MSWVAFHANRQDLTESPTTTSFLIAHFQEDVATIAMVRPSLDVIKKVTELVHPGQPPVVAMDQPLLPLPRTSSGSGLLSMQSRSLLSCSVDCTSSYLP